MRTRHGAMHDDKHHHEEKQHPQPDAHEQDAPEQQERPSAFEEQVAKLTEERDRLNEQLLRTLADMQNQRKRYQQEAHQVRAFATEDLVRELLPVLDNFERTIAAAEGGASFENVIEGIRAVDRQIRSALERRNVSRIKAHGEPFNPDYHEAIGTEESDEHEEGTVTGEVEAGYKMADKVIRPARVRVAKKR